MFLCGSQWGSNSILSSSSFSAANTVVTSKGTFHLMQILEETWQQIFQSRDRSQFNHQTALGTEQSHHTRVHLHTQKISVLQQPGLVQLERNHLLTTQHHTQQWRPPGSLTGISAEVSKTGSYRSPDWDSFISQMVTPGTRGNRYL